MNVCSTTSRRARSAIAALAIALACLAGIGPTSVAAASGGNAGALDRSFGHDGVVTADFGTEPTTGTALAVIADDRGRLLVLQPGPRGIAVARYFPGGHLDTTFGDRGVALNRSASCYEGSLGLGPGGTVVASCSDAIVRFTAAGEIDRDFGVDGLVGVDALVQRPRYSWEINLAQSVTQEDGGTIVMYASDGGATVARYDADGSLDRAFGQDGRVTLQGPYFQRAPVRLLGLPDGKILFAAVGTIDTLDGLIVGRLDADGQPDPSFGTGGFTEIKALRKGLQGIAALPDGSFYVAGLENRFVHVSAAGVWDQAFGGDGIAPGPAKFGTVHAIVAAPDGGLLAAGTLAKDPYGAARLLLERLTAGGYPAPGFGPNGFVTAKPNPGRRHEARDLIELPGGDVVLVGAAGHSRRDTDPSQVTLAAFRPDGQLDRAFGEGGTVLTPGTSAAIDSVAALLVDERGCTVAVGRAGGRSAVVRFGRGGGRDAGFGSDGLVRLPEAGNPRFATATAVAPSPRGRLLVSVGSYGNGGVFRLGRRGHLDRSFGVGGLAGARRFESVTDLLATPDGGFLAAGSTLWDSIIARFGSRGRPARGYGREGGTTVAEVWIGNDVRLARSSAGTVAVLAIPEMPIEYGPRGHRLETFAPPGHARRFRRLLPTRIEDLAFDRHGRLLLVGARDGRVAISRLLADGRLDRSFGAGGLVLTSAGAYSGADRIGVEADGRIVVAGLARPCPYGRDCQRGRALALRYLPDGRLDRSFGDRGRFLDPLHQVVEVTALALGPGSITIGGTAEPGVEDRQFYLARLSR
jgi:uncharacterized delta-60 repeat protein